MKDIKGLGPIKTSIGGEDFIEQDHGTIEGAGDGIKKKGPPISI